MTKIILALDTIEGPKINSALRYWPESAWVKIGLESYVYFGPSIRNIIGRSRPLFLDLKFYDIPQTVIRAIGASGVIGPDMITIHITQDKEMIVKSVEASKRILSKLIGVIKLSSSKFEWTDDSFNIDNIKRYYEWGVDGLVIPPWIWENHPELREFMFLNKMISIIPGVRPSWATDNHDHSNTIELKKVYELKPDFIVMGCPLMMLAPEDMMKYISNEIG